MKLIAVLVFIGLVVLAGTLFADMLCPQYPQPWRGLLTVMALFGYVSLVNGCIKTLTTPDMKEPGQPA